MGLWMFRYIPVASGDFPLKFLLREQCKLSECIMPEFAKIWINLRGEYERVADVKVEYPVKNELNHMCEKLGIKLNGNDQGRDSPMFKNYS
jgi:hypothetical protein